MPQRRTQEERRETTIRSLLDATREALIEVGYARATMQEICARAGVSQGGLFRHFATREALMVAAGEDIGKQVLEQYRGRFRALGRRRSKDDTLLVAMTLVRALCRSRINQAWFELTAAARTSATLRKALRPAAIRYHAEIDALARDLLPDLAARLGDRLPLLVDTAIALFDGEVIHHTIVDKPRLQAERLKLLAAVLPLIS